MGIEHFVPKIVTLFLVITFHCSSPFAAPSSSFCDITPFPDLCKYFLPQNKSTNIHDHVRLSIHLSSSATTQFLDSINGYLNSKNTSSQSSIFVLQDCQLLIGLNLDFLSNVAATISQPGNTLQGSKFDDVETLLSASITNQQTCLDSLQITPSAADIASQIFPTLANGSMMYSVSLALFKYGWLPNSPTRGGRKLLQISGISSVNVTQMVVVNPDGSGNYTTINDAIAAAPNNTKAGNGYYKIYVVAGVYQEYVSIASNKKYLMMVGDGINKTIITGNHSVVDGWTTFNSATFAVVGEGFLAMNITFQNTAGAIKHQAVAVRNGADLSTFYSCSFEGYQDTLYTHSMRQFYRECDIYGTVDFIFGNAAVVFQNCNIYPRLPLQGQFNPITAQGRTDINQNTGTSIHNCTIKAAPDLASSNGTTQTYLGRPWKEYSRTVYMQSFMDSLINPAGWAAWSGDFALSTLYYAEYNNTGPGSNTSSRVTWPGYHVINSTDAISFTVSNFIAGNFWLPATGVPYTGDLL
ncbi:PREDICTED: probable pectinesterase/pectinesterase inhibitor 41 [Nicotiana attenuata]|uniref:Pectinesterase n=1 Tax=Nicotiana attenuata TaxID=49451 RepID=A0A314LBS1_NICAT|nr:PREDICTED: probable pectinesterase/pectinesterase inhibitor 41 [Nicotiana attenuata]OIT39075.1 putative pectinesterasepectinesterase inhibitor 20 [Nicotiana attenuata]